MDSFPHIDTYRKALEELPDKPGEMRRREYILKLLQAYAREERRQIAHEQTQPGGKRPDGTLENELHLPVGWWESKGSNTVLENEVKKKINEGYPTDNTLFENGKKAILYRNRRETRCVSFDNAKALHECLKDWVGYQPPEVQRFEKAIKRFREDVPALLKKLRGEINNASMKNKDYISLQDNLLEHCKTYINPNMGVADIREMVIQHILTTDIFRAVFHDPDFHKQNHLAKEIERLQKALLGEKSRQAFLSSIGYYYDTLRATAVQVEEHRKQDFLKSIYEEFYKAYNPKAADRLGIVYTPTEVVRFIVRNANLLLKEHFKKGIGDKDVDILDPATGTGTFLCELMNQIPKEQLAHKYTHELHANEVSLLAYYIANLNIEHAYKQITRNYKDFSGLCFVDTLDLDISYVGKQKTLMAGLSDENIRRVEDQQKKPIQLIIGNPPYNDNQKNENDNNKNRPYPEVDKRIKNTFIHKSRAKKPHAYDMYARFYRWAMDRIKDEGMVAFITNRSFIDAYAYDGFRSMVARDFDFAYILDLGGNLRAEGDEAGGNVFNIKTGVAIMFLIKEKQGERPCCIRYRAYSNTWDKETKLRNLEAGQGSPLTYDIIKPDEQHNWIIQSDTDFEGLIPICGKGIAENEAVLFKLCTPGVKTNRDSWVYDRCPKRLEKKMRASIERIRRLSKNDTTYPTTIKWSRDLKKKFSSSKWTPTDFDKKKIVRSAYRPFTVLHYYADTYWGDVLTSNHTEAFGEGYEQENTCICFLSKSKPFHVLATRYLPDFHFTGDSQCLPLYRYNREGERMYNLTKWGLAQFRSHYRNEGITPEQVFAYTYAVFHAPAYKEKYALDLRQQFPRLPFYGDFHALAAQGQALLDLHTGYEKAVPYDLTREEGELSSPGPRLRFSKKEEEAIEIDENTTLYDVPKEAQDYTLGARSALEWVLDQYKEKKENLPAIEELASYRLADYKEEAILLLKRVCTVSCETMRIVKKIDSLTHLRG